MKTRYTAVFEFDGEEPLVKISDGWHGGTLIRVAYRDELAKLDAVTAAAHAMLDAVEDDTSERMDKVWCALDNALMYEIQP